MLVWWRVSRQLPTPQRPWPGTVSIDWSLLFPFRTWNRHSSWVRYDAAVAHLQLVSLVPGLSLGMRLATCHCIFLLCRSIPSPSVWASHVKQWSTDQGNIPSFVSDVCPSLITVHVQQSIQQYCDYFVRFHFRLQPVSCSMPSCCSSLAGVPSQPCRRRLELLTRTLALSLGIFHNERSGKRPYSTPAIIFCILWSTCIN